MNNLLNSFKELSLDDKWILVLSVVIAFIFAAVGIFMLIKGFCCRLAQRIRDFNDEDIEEE